MSDHFEHQLRQHLGHEAAQVRHFPRPLASRIEAAVQSGRRPATLQQLALAAGLVILVVLLAVGVSQARSSRSEPAGVPGPWKENLTFSGAVTGTVRSTLTGDDAGLNTCIGKYATGDGWAANLVVELNGEPYQLQMTVIPYRGPGTYSNTTGSRTVFLRLFSASESSWGTSPDDPARATMTLDPGNESGTVDATLTGYMGPAAIGPNIVRISGHWTCHTRT